MYLAGCSLGSSSFCCLSFIVNQKNDSGGVVLLAYSIGYKGKIVVITQGL